TEESPMAPCSRKGEIRVRLAEERLAAHARGDLCVAIGRASDFFGPGVTNASVFGERFYRRVLAGKSGESLGDPDALHSYSYGPDVAAGLAVLGARDEAPGRVWHLPVPPAESTRRAIERMSTALEVAPRVGRVPDLALRAMGLFSPVIREVVEMTYQWRAPFVLDDARFRATFGVAATDLDAAMRDTARWARGAFGTGAHARAA
ncbi:MAG: NAD-dependent epimerase, partial [Deltaproteobacteria bacterium]